MVFVFRTLKIPGWNHSELSTLYREARQDGALGAGREP